MQSIYTFIALDLARERAEEARQQRRLALARSSTGATQRPSALRRGMAHTLAAVSRGSASIARRLDGGLGEDVVQGLSPTR